MTLQDPCEGLALHGGGGAEVERTSHVGGPITAGSSRHVEAGKKKHTCQGSQEEETDISRENSQSARIIQGTPGRF